MQDYQKEFVEFIIKADALKFGNFTLKSGRLSPYFFDTGVFNNGQYLAKLGYFYAHTIRASGIKFDVLFGPAYKGIPLVSSTAIAFSHHFKQKVRYSFNRKEKKMHGEGGTIVGAALQNKVFIIDDVITAGTAISESMHIIKLHQAKAVGAIIALDRKERGTKNVSATTELENKLHIPIISIINLTHIMRYLKQKGVQVKNTQEKKYTELLYRIECYRDKYGV